MKRMVFKNVYLLGGIFLLVTLMSVQLSWCCDDHDSWDCHEACQPPKIQRVFLEFKPTPDPSDTSEPFIRFSIWGKNFAQGAPPVVALGGEFDLTVKRYEDDYIIATLPMSVEEDFYYGDYRLVVSTCQDPQGKYCMDSCSKCKGKHCRDYCSKCKDRYCKSKYYKDNEHRCRCKDRYSLTIQNPQGPSSSAIGFKIKSTTLTLPPAERRQFRGTAECDSGFRVTGGGFSCRDCMGILVNEPLIDGNGNGIGWVVIAVYEGTGSELKIHAICTQAQ